MKRRLKRFLLLMGMLVVVLTGYVLIVTRNSHNMTVRQRMLKAFYPLLMTFSKKNNMENSTVTPTSSIYDLAITLNNGTTQPLSAYKGKKILLVNTASNCGYTNQYEDLQKLYAGHLDKIVVIGFPANDFKEQEKGSDEEIASFCKMNYGVSFPLAMKSTVIKGTEQNPVFKWLSDKDLNGWNDQQPTWNFSKYLVDENGKLINYFDPGTSPADNAIQKAIGL